MILASDLDGVPADLLKSLLQVLGWLMTTGIATWLGHKWGKRGSKESPVSIDQPLDVRQHDDAAKRSELAKVEASLNTFTVRVDSLAEQMNAQFAAMTKNGQDRAAAIAQDINEEVGSLRQDIGELAEALHEKINRSLQDNARQSAEIDSLKAGSYRHDAEVARIQEHIAALLARPVCSHKPR